MASMMTGVPPGARASDAGASPADIASLLEKLHDLMQKGILTEAEFAAKKGELLSKLK